MNDFDYESVVIAACAALPADIDLDAMSLVDAVTTLVRQRDEARADASIWERHYEVLRDEGAAATMAIPVAGGIFTPDEAHARDNDVYRGALWELRGYMQELDDAGTLTVSRVLGWLDHAIEGNE